MATENTSSRKKPRKKKRARQWNATVDLPRGAAMQDSPPLIINYLGKTLAVDTLEDIDPAGLLPGRTFKAVKGKRNRPIQPHLYNSGRQIIVESETEGIEAQLSDRDPTVKGIVPQGVWIKCLVPSHIKPDQPPRWAWYCADFLIQHQSGRLAVIEVKRRDLTFRPRPVLKLLAAADACRRLNLDFEIRAGLNLLEGMAYKQLHHGRRSRYLAHPTHDLLRAAMIDATSDGPVTLAELRSLGNTTVTATLIWELVWHGALCFDWNKPIETNTPIRRHSPACKDAAGTSAWDFTCGPRRVDLLAEMQEWAAAL